MNQYTNTNIALTPGGSSISNIPMHPRMTITDFSQNEKVDNMLYKTMVKNLIGQYIYENVQGLEYSIIDNIGSSFIFVTNESILDREDFYLYLKKNGVDFTDSSQSKSHTCLIFEKN